MNVDCDEIENPTSPITSAVVRAGAMIELNVSDIWGNTNTILVEPEILLEPNQSPIANGFSDGCSLSHGLTTCCDATLDGSGSFDPDNDLIEFFCMLTI